MATESKLSIKERRSGHNIQHFCGHMKTGKSFLLDNYLVNQSNRTKASKLKSY